MYRDQNGVDSSDDESYDSSNEDLFIVSKSIQSVNDAQKDGYNDGAISTQSTPVEIRHVKSKNLEEAPLMIPRSKPAQHVKEYQDKPFTISNCKLFCMGCREEICVSIVTI